MSGPVVVISPAPNANGDLHLGHVAGPFLAADVFTRYTRATGREVLFGTGAQDSSSFVMTTANRLGITPRALVASSIGQIETTLTALGIAVDGFTGDDDRHAKVVLNFLDRLHATGRLRLRRMAFPYLPRTGEFLVDAYVRGGCPVCLTEGCAGLCESCGHPVAAGDLIDPRSTMHPGEPVLLRETEVLVLPVEDYRHQLRDYFADHRSVLRPHMAQAIGEMLSGPLPDYPVTYPTSWGIPAPFPGVTGQVINPNAEAMAWSIYSTALSAEARGHVLAAEDELWLADAGTTVAYFLGFDNIYPFAVAGLAMLMAHGGRYLLPEQYLTNEFYELDSSKFSTSRGHAVWGRELAAEGPRDLIRFHLAATSPEYQRTDFSRAALATLTRTRLVEPWNRVASKVQQWVGRGPLPVSRRSHTAAARIADRFTAAYDLAGFSLHRAAATIADQVARLDGWEAGRDDAGDFCHQVQVVLRCSAPILIDLATVLPDTTFPVGGGPAATEVTPRSLPRLSGWTG
jgi:methionyl-tRNA synthetase